ncbi:MarR family winged helix-turn-helix transcriptional regulator [Streptomyces anandii]|uniref:MarR family winged helix-turn-helix transcriptional regulator n=1 Tax=Streptomyces anandii TaxID=285454 RepID=A0ABW6HC34_9ACTN
MYHRTAESTSAAGDAPAAGDPAEQVVRAILAAARLLTEVSAHALASVDETLTLPRFRLLSVLDSLGAMNLTRLAQALDVLPSTALRMTERLVAHGLLQREPSPASRREIVISLTAAGRHVVHQVSEARRAHIAHIVTAMPCHERAGLLQVLHTFTTASGQLAHVEHAAVGPQWP